MFSQTAEYAVRAVVMLAHIEEDGPVGSAQLAQRAHIPPSYLAKILGALSKAGLVNSRRGARGGFRLARSAEEITIYDIVEAVDPIPRIRGCPLGLASHRDLLCPLHARLDESLALVEEVLSRSTVAELLRSKERPTPMIETAEFLGGVAARTEAALGTPGGPDDEDAA